MLKYYQQFHGATERKGIDYDKALDILLGSFKDNDMTRDMLTIPNRIQCMYSTVTVEQENGMVLAAGLYNMLPDEFCYDDEGNHKEN